MKWLTSCTTKSTWQWSTQETRCQARFLNTLRFESSGAGEDSWTDFNITVAPGAMTELMSSNETCWDDLPRIRCHFTEVTWGYSKVLPWERLVIIETRLCPKGVLLLFWVMSSRSFKPRQSNTAFMIIQIWKSAVWLFHVVYHFIVTSRLVSLPFRPCCCCTQPFIVHLIMHLLIHQIFQH